MNHLTTAQSVRESILAHLRSKTAVDIATLNEEQPLVAGALLDSLQLIELIIWIEEQTGEAIEPDELMVDDDVSVSAIERYVMARQVRPA